MRPDFTCETNHSLCENLSTYDKQCFQCVLESHSWNTNLKNKLDLATFCNLFITSLEFFVRLRVAILNFGIFILVTLHVDPDKKYP